MRCGPGKRHVAITDTDTVADTIAIAIAVTDTVADTIADTITIAVANAVAVADTRLFARWSVQLSRTHRLEVRLHLSR